MWSSILTCIFAVLAVLCAANTRGADEAKKVYGSAFLDPCFEPGEAVQDAVKLRYKCRVVANECVRPEMWKIIFMFHFLHAPGNAKAYELQSNLYTWRFTYPHLSKRKTSGEVEGLGNVAGETGLFLSIPDNHKDKRIGARSGAPPMFPTLDQEIDGFKDLWKREQVSQSNVTGQTLAIEIARGAVASDLRGWSVHSELPEGKYRTWTITAAWGDASYKVDFVAPDESARYFGPASITRIATEAFFIHPGLFKAYFWDIDFQREGQVKWEPIWKWKLIETDATAEGNTWGMKRSTIDGRAAIEVSNDGTRTYLKKGEILDLK